MGNIVVLTRQNAGFSLAVTLMDNVRDWREKDENNENEVGR